MSRPAPKKNSVMASTAAALDMATLATREYSAPGFWCLGFHAPAAAASARPAQFAALDIPGAFAPRLPLGIWTARDEQIGFLFREWGERTRRLAQLQVGAQISVIAPLGNAFEAPPRGRRAVMVAGGLGIVPFWMLARDLVNAGSDALAVIGARTSQLLVGAELLERLGVRVVLCTDDGSAGRRGSVLDIVRELAQPTDELYGCGPAAMLRALCGFALEAGLPCQVSMEETFGCSMGTCWGCVVPVRPGSAQATNYPKAPDERRPYDFARVCADGTVFRAADLVWNP